MFPPQDCGNIYRLPAVAARTVGSNFNEESGKAVEPNASCKRFTILI